MRNYEPDRTALTGVLLAAHPAMQDPNFSKSIVLITDHDAKEGAMGFVLNRPLNKTVGDLPTPVAFPPMAKLPLHLGGPVSPDHLIFNSLSWDEGHEVLVIDAQLEPHVVVDKLDEARDLVLAFLGYAGWTPGQLEAEIAQKAWVVYPPTKEILNPDTLATLWVEIMKRSSPWLRILAEAPDDPSDN